MTERDWMTSGDPEMLFAILSVQGLRNERKLTLAGCACFRRHWNFVADKTLRQAVIGAELFVDQRLSQAELISMHMEADRLWNQLHSTNDSRLSAMVGYAAAATYLSGRVYDENVLSNVIGAIVEALTGETKDEIAKQLEILRDVFGNPFRPAVLAPDWRTNATVALAHSIYDDRSFDSLPVLADALEEAGCADHEVLTHCRGGSHVRGCWVVDLLLGKA